MARDSTFSGIGSANDLRSFRYFYFAAQKILFITYPLCLIDDLHLVVLYISITRRIHWLLWGKGVEFFLVLFSGKAGFVVARSNLGYPVC